jgi:hypothetical protein
MSTLAVAAATVQFIGIILMSRENGGVHAIIPPVPPPSAVVTSGSGARSVPIDIEKHTAFIAFPTTAVIFNGWGSPLSTFTASTNMAFSYVELHGEEIVFDTLSRKNSVVTGQNLDLPKMSFPTPTPAPLRPEYRAPYKGAVGVVDLPQGDLHACKASLMKGPSITRTDTQLKLQTNGVIVIRTVNGSKAIVLWANEQTYVANVPMVWATTLQHDNHHAFGHWKAYYLMTMRPDINIAPAEPTWTTPQCTGAAFIPPSPGGGTTDPVGVGNSNTVQLVALMPTITDVHNLPRIGTDLQVLVSTAECSNTTYP